MPERSCGIDAAVCEDLSEVTLVTFVD